MKGEGSQDSGLGSRDQVVQILEEVGRAEALVS